MARHVLLLQYKHFFQIEKKKKNIKVTDLYTLVEQRKYQFQMHSPLHLLLLCAAFHRYMKHNLSSRLHGNKIHKIMNSI